MAVGARTGLVATAERPSATSAGAPGGKSIDPGKLAEQAQRLPLPAKIALPAMLANTMRQERLMAELNDTELKPAAEGLKPGPSSVSLIPDRAGFVEFGVELVEARIVERSAMKAAPARSILEGNLTAGTSLEASAEMLNEMQRARGGDIVQEDMSRYQVSLRAPGAKEAWTGEVIGPPKLFPLQTVNVLTANKLMIVFDKSNKKLWQSSLAYNVVGGLGALDAQSARYGQGPCVERKGSLYVFDEGVLTAFDLSTGNARWRLPSVGITGLFFDDKDNLYVNTTTASHDTLKYSRQIDLSRNVSSIVLKLDSKNGTVRWKANMGGLISYVSGKFIFAVDAYQPSDDEEDSPLGDLAPQKGPHLRIRRINPSNGSEIWEHYEERAPLDIAFDQNVIRLVFKREVEVLRFLSF